MTAHYGAPLIAGKAVYGTTELGILGSVIRSTTGSGPNGAGLLYNDWDGSGDDGKRFRALIVSGAPAGAFFNEDGSFSVPAGTADGTYTVTYRLFVDGADLGTTTAAITVGAAGATFSVAPAALSVAVAYGSPVVSSTAPSGFSVSPAALSVSISYGAPSVSFTLADPGEPVSLQQAKTAARMEIDELDGEILSVITAAREQAEHITGRVYKRRTFRFELDAWPADDHRFPVYDPSLCEVSYFDESRNWVALAPAAFEFAGIGSGAEIAPALDTSWPSLGRRAVGARVRVTFTAGPGNPDEVAECVKLYIKSVVSGWVNNPEAVQAKALTFSPLFEHLLDEQRIYG